MQQSWPFCLVWIGLLLLPGGCAAFSAPEPEPCDKQERQAAAAKIAPLSPAQRQQIQRAFEKKNRIQRANVVQQECHFILDLAVDTFTDERYGRIQADSLIRAVKAKAPNETPPLSQVAGTGLYDYVVTVQRDTVEMWIKGIKRYSDPHVMWTR